MHKFVHVGLAFPGVPKVRDLEPTITRVSSDWIRYSVTNWILWTDKRADEIYWALALNLDPQDQVLVAAIDHNQMFGFLSPWMWTWMQSKLPETGVVFGDDLRQQLTNALNPMLPKV